LENGTEIRSWMKDQPGLLSLIEMHNVSKPIKARNVVATLKGTSSKLRKEKIIIGGHLDSWDAGEGAHDDGAGVIHCLEALRILKELKYNL
jgi:Zn-dependent M28 family amino/carboxypeptidase